MPPSRQLGLELTIQLGCLLIVCSHATQTANSIVTSPTNGIDGRTEADEEFAHLLNRAADTRRIHLISEHTRNGHRLQVEEFLDLESWSQLLQFKWHEDEKLEVDNGQTLSTKKINVIVLNDGNQKVIVQYEPYTCHSRTISVDNFISDADWWEFVADSLAMKDYDANVTPRQRHTETIQSIISTAANTPYFARVPTTSDAEAWVFGVAGLWLKAQYPNPSNTTPSQVFHFERGNKVKDSRAWILNLVQANAKIMYYFNSDFIGFDEDNKLLDSRPSNANYDRLNLIEVRNYKSNLIDMINIIDIDMDVSDQLTRDLYKLPIGYNCPTNPILSSKGLYFDHPLQNMQATLRELEVVATRFGRQLNTSFYSSTDIKSLSVASCKHPINSAASISMIHILEDHLKLVRDYHSRIEYRMQSGKVKDHCTIRGIHIYDFNHRQATESVEVRFHNGIILNWNDVFTDYLLNSKSLNEAEQRYLNHIEVSSNKEELVFESQVPESYTEFLQVIDERTNKPVARTISLIRVYDRSYSENTNNLYKLRRKQAARLSRIIMVVFDHRRLEKLAEVRLNIIKTVGPLSFVRRAQLFDVSRCHDKDVMELVVSYPAETRLVKYAESRSHELVDEFYLSSIYWGAVDVEAKNTTLSKEKQRLGVSLNFMRVPKVKLLGSSGDKLQLQLTIVDKVPLIYLFDQLVESTFVTNDIDERLLVSNAMQCSNLCQLHNCRMFAFDEANLECKLSPVSTEDELVDEDDFGNNPNENYVTVVRKATSKIYYAPSRQDKIDSQAPFEEASLSELHSYLEHHVGQLDLETAEDKNREQDEDQEPEDTFVSGDSRAQRQARDVSEQNPTVEWPLLSFEFNDKSDTKRRYGPAQRLRLVPSEIIAVHVPITIDVSQEYQRIKVLSAFRTQDSGKTFQLNLLDDPQWTPERILNSDERTYYERHSSTYYSLRRLYLMDVETCALMCFNIDTFDTKASAEQICQWFSYCSKQKECILVVKTDTNFTQSLIDLVQEGDRMLDINSTDQLLVDKSGCIVSTRNYLAGFDGPIRLHNGLHGYKTTGYSHLFNQIEFEWLTAFNIESSEIYEDSQDNCAKECNNYNRLGRNCVALDFCITKMTTFDNHQPTIRYKTNCDIFLLLTEYDPSERSSILIRIRENLAKPSGVKENRTGELDAESNCNRYLVSHLSEFNHIRMRQVSNELAVRLERPKFKMNNINLDGCALECSTRGNECLAFEYCSKFNDETKAVQMNCSLFGKPKVHSLSNKLDQKSTSLVEQVSVYSRDCHIYLRSEFKSLEELLEFKATSLPSATFEHEQLLVYCTIFYILSVVSVLLYYKSISRNHQRFH